MPQNIVTKFGHDSRVSHLVMGIDTKTKISINIEKRNILKFKKNYVDVKNYKVFGTKYLKKNHWLNCKGSMFGGAYGDARMPNWPH